MKLGGYGKLYLAIYGLLALLIVLPLLGNGYILTLDMVFGPEIKLMDYGDYSSSYPFFIVLKFLSLFLPTAAIQKIILFLILFLSGVFMHKLVKTESEIPRYFAGMLYMINPFVYTRFLAGHYLLLLAYALMPLAIGFIIDFFKSPSAKNSVKASILIAVTGLLYLHMLVVMLFLFIAFLVYYLVRSRKKHKAARQIIKSSAFVIVLVLLVNSFWIANLFFKPGIIRQIGPADLEIFSTKPALYLNVLTNTAMMYGFWRGGYILPKEIVPWYIYYPLFFAVLFFAVHGYRILKEEHKKPLLFICIASLILATGITHNIFSKLYILLFNNLFFFRGFREPQKLVALVVLAYCYFGAYGIGDIMKKAKLKVLFLAFLIIPFAYTPTMFGSFWHQLQPADYPADWYETNDFLNNDSSDFSVLFLPWHMYMDFSFNPKQRITNPAKVFFDKPVISGDNIEAGRIFSQSTSQVSRHVEYTLANNENITDMGRRFRQINVKYIILSKDADYQRYYFLFNQTDLELVSNTTSLYLFKIK